MKKDKAVKGGKSEEELKKTGKSNDKSEGMESVDLNKMLDANLASSPIPKTDISSQNLKEALMENIDENQTSTTNDETKLTSIVIKK
jgi:hypothetical protein